MSLVAVVETLVEGARQTTAARTRTALGRPAPVNRSLRYVGTIEGVRCEVRLRVVRIENEFKNVYRIEGTLATARRRRMFECDGYTGHGRFIDEWPVQVQVTAGALALTIGAPGEPVPTHYLGRA